MDNLGERSRILCIKSPQIIENGVEDETYKESERERSWAGKHQDSKGRNHYDTRMGLV